MTREAGVTCTGYEHVSQSVPLRYTSLFVASSVRVSALLCAIKLLCNHSVKIRRNPIKIWRRS
jgi:hypothetical protein